MHVAGRELVSGVAVEPRYVLAAGRSGRDYRTLFDAVRGRDIRLRVVCDNTDALAGLDVPPNAVVLRDCYGSAYIDELAGASIVAVPLAVNDISAGQMVMLQAMAFGKPVVVTRTPTTQEYVTDNVQALLVPRADPAAMRSAIETLLSSPERIDEMGRAGLQTFEEKFSMRSYVRNVLAAI
jgi:glycosyltransferase involved in cell wall biosynthesis